MKRPTFWGTRHSFICPRGFFFSEQCEAELKPAIKVRRVFSPAIFIANFFNKNF